MTDDRTLAALDQRARAAAAGVRTAVAERPAPTFDPDVLRIDVDARGDRPERPSRPVVAVLAAAAAVLVVVAAVVALSGQGDPDSVPADRTPFEVGRYVLPDLPDGFAVANVQEGPDQALVDIGPGLPAGPVAVYGPDERTPVVGLYVWPEDSGTPEDPDDDIDVTLDEMDEIEVAGRRAWEPSAVDVGVFELIVEVDGTYAVVLGAAASRDEVRAAGAAVEVEGDRARLPEAARPDGWSDLGEVSAADLFSGVVGLGRLGGDVAWLVSYLRGAGDAEGILSLSADPGEPVGVWAGALVSDDVEDVEVRGHPGQVSRVEYIPGEVTFVTLTWEERSGEIVRVGSSVLDRDDLLAQAATMRPATDEELAELRRLAEDAAAAGGLIVGEGTFDSGTGWTLVHGLYDSDDLALDVSAPESMSSGTASDSGSGSGSGIDGTPGDRPPLDGIGSGTGGDDAWAYGRLNDDVDRVEVRLDGSDQRVEVTIVEQDGIRGWVADLPVHREGEAPAGEVVAYAADGTELARQGF